MFDYLVFVLWDYHSRLYTINSAYLMDVLISKKLVIEHMITTNQVYSG